MKAILLHWDEGDWIALADETGKILLEGHSIGEREVLKLMGIEVLEVSLPAGYQDSRAFDTVGQYVDDAANFVEEGGYRGD